MLFYLRRGSMLK